MKTYKDFKPTQFDHHYHVEDRENWLLAPVSTNRDADCLTRANWQAFIAEMGDESELTYEIHRFGHWGPGWFEILLINPDNKELVRKAESIEAALENYPVTDDELFSQIESDEANEVWSSCYTWRDRIEYIRKHASQFEFNDLIDMVHCVRGEYFNGYASELIN